MVTFEVTALVPSIPRRARLLARARDSVAAQTLPAAAMLARIDREGVGAAATRDKLLAAVSTPWVAPLDDDDEWKPDHLAGLAAVLEETGADLAYSWYEIVGPSGEVEQWRDPHAAVEGMDWDPEHPTQVPTTWMARTELIRAVGGWSDFGRWSPAFAGTDAAGHRIGEDTLLIHRLNAIGAHIVHRPVRTYRWHHWGGNSSGWVGNAWGLTSRS